MAWLQLVKLLGTRLHPIPKEAKSKLGFFLPPSKDEPTLQSNSEEHLNRSFALKATTIQYVTLDCKVVDSSLRWLLSGLSAHRTNIGAIVIRIGFWGPLL